ncbi:hypothetical protein [Prevotella sp. tf2-5]|uniref:hypothetical protein n=1 Tax=Prevotella sp. tf2-5 TaxID=1761889 RepID=UPI0008E65081|nr:hypothetical protein [Prevotella sp. tf2-5]SFP02913.1 hypothetical protein SAMN04487852_11361 [Prevotella sp. tf2-5]
MGLVLKKSLAYSLLKKRIGQANHFLITILVGLDEVSKGNAKKSATLDAKWDPKDVKVSASRSRTYALNSSLAWIVDNFDSYVQNCKRKPSFIENNELRRALDSADRRVNEKFEVLYNRYKATGDLKLYGALIALGIQWRNVTTHSGGDNVLDNEYEGILQENKDWYTNNFCHLDVDKAQDSFNKRKNPSLKEVASIIKSVLRFVEIVDKELIKEIDVERYVKDLLDKHYPKESKERRLFANQTREHQLSKIKQLLLNSGFVYEEGDGLLVDNEFLTKYMGDIKCQVSV